MIVVVSGETCAGQSAFVAESEVYDPRTDKWRMFAPIPTPRDEFAIGAIGDCIYTAGGSGRDHDFQYNLTEIYCAPLRFDWDFGDGANATGEDIEHAYAAPGVYTVTLTVTDLLGAQGTDTLAVTVTGNRPPVPHAVAVLADEGAPALLDASGSKDPDGDPLMFRWDVDGDGTWDTPFSPDSVSAYVWGDDYGGTAAVEVYDGQASATAAFAVTVRNVSPLLGPPLVRSVGDAFLTLRVAGEKYHDVTATLFRDEAPVGNTTVTRVPGSPDDQAAVLGTVRTDGAYRVDVAYTPLDDSVNGQVWGATPAWLILEQGGAETRFHHTFNARHEDTWTWSVDGLEAHTEPSGLELSLPVTDPGSDDLTVTVDWADGTTDVLAFPNDPAGPDPFPSPDVHPRTFVVSARHVYAVPGTYDITVTVEDDDGGQSVLVLSLTLP